LAWLFVYPVPSFLGLLFSFLHPTLLGWFFSSAKFLGLALLLFSLLSFFLILQINPFLYHTYTPKEAERQVHRRIFRRVKARRKMSPCATFVRPLKIQIVR
jgi:hypothetical protein